MSIDEKIVLERLESRLKNIEKDIKELQDVILNLIKCLTVAHLI